MRISPELLDQIVAHARRDLPNECCGAVGVRDGRAVRVYPLENTAASPYKFEMGVDLYRALVDIEDSGAELAIYHSHPRTEAYPSLTDMAWSEQYPGAEWLIVGHVVDEPVVRCFRVTKQEVEELDLEVG